MKRLISMLLLLAMLTAALVACGSDDTGKDGSTTPAETTTGSGDAETTTPEETTEYLEAQDLGGYAFRYLSHADNPHISYDPAELDTNSIADQAKIKRDSEIKDKFNFDFEDVDYAESDKISA